jgi:hypothetical protein
MSIKSDRHIDTASMRAYQHRLRVHHISKGVVLANVAVDAQRGPTKPTLEAKNGLEKNPDVDRVGVVNSGSGPTRPTSEAEMGLEKGPGVDRVSAVIHPFQSIPIQSNPHYTYNLHCLYVFTQARTGRSR